MGGRVEDWIAEKGIEEGTEWDRSGVKRHEERYVNGN